MRGVEIVPERRIVRVQGGVRGGDVQAEGARHGLGAVTGALSGTGVGLMLGGGFGHLSPRAGYAADNILSLEVVTASGEVVVASPDENSDLFWAMRGSLGNFGVVTALELQLHDVPALVYGGTMTWSLDQAGRVVEAIRAVWEGSDHLSLVPFLSNSSLEGRGGLEMFVCHTGTAAEARVDIERIRAIVTPDEQSLEMTPFADIHFQYDDWFPSMRGITIQQAVTNIGDDMSEALINHIRQSAGGGTRVIELLPLRGALGRPPRFPSALRETAETPTWSLLTGCWWESSSEDSQHETWARDVVADIQRIGPTAERRDPGTHGIPVDPAGVAQMYGDRFDRLREVKRRWDPHNLFVGAPNIPPAEK